jgi:ketosteroid isomerase-like protein
MSQENVELVRRFIDAINRGDIDAAITSASKDCEANLANSRGPERGIYQGRDQTREFLNSFLEAWAYLRWEPEEFIELEDDRVLTVSQLQMRGHGSGAEVSVKGASIWAIRGSEIAALTIYQSKADAIEAAGLPE